MAFAIKQSLEKKCDAKSCNFSGCDKLTLLIDAVVIVTLAAFATWILLHGHFQIKNILICNGKAIYPIFGVALTFLFFDCLALYKKKQKVEIPKLRLDEAYYAHVTDGYLKIENLKVKVESDRTINFEGTHWVNSGGLRTPTKEELVKIKEIMTPCCEGFEGSKEKNTPQQTYKLTLPLKFPLDLQNRMYVFIAWFEDKPWKVHSIAKKKECSALALSVTPQNQIDLTEARWIFHDFSEKELNIEELEKVKVALTSYFYLEISA